MQARRENRRPSRGAAAERGSGMEPATRRVQQAHLRAAQDAVEPRLQPFPSRVLWGLLAGVALGALAGLLISILLGNFALVVPGWDELYSMGPFTFHVFWILMGVAVGVGLIGVGTLLAASPAENTSPRE